MHYFCFALLWLTASLSLTHASDWPWWRGPNHNGVALAKQGVPFEIGKEQIRWSADVPGRAHGSATVAGSFVFLAAAELSTQTQSLLCFDRVTGRKLWDTVVHQGGWPEKSNKKGSQASSTPACDGERVYINFYNGGAVHTTALSVGGQILWQTSITDYIVHQSFSSSPALYEDLVIVAADNKGGGAICALNQESGEVMWKVERPPMPNYVSPILLEAAGRQQLVFTGCELVTSLDPATGEKLWEVEGSTTECVTSVVTDGERVFTSGGYPKNHVSAIQADGSGKLVWEAKNRVYVPSMLVSGDYLYAVMDAGVAVCWNAETGEEMWKGRLGGTFSSSLVLVGTAIFAANESGEILVFRADPESFEILAESKVADEIYASPAICGGAIYIRVAFLEGDTRQEKLLCIAR